MTNIEKLTLLIEESRQKNPRRKRGNPMKWTQKQIIQALKDGRLTLTDVIDAVIATNGIIGVGLITLGDSLKEYCYNKIKPL